MSRQPTVVRFHDGERFATGIVCRVGTKYTHIVTRDGNVDVTRIVNGTVTVPLLFKGKPYPVARAARILRKAGRHAGITKRAATLLRGL